MAVAICWASRSSAAPRGDELREAEQAPCRICSGRDCRPRAERVEQRPQSLVEIEIADHRHARHQQPLPGLADERLGHRARGAAARQQQGQVREAQVPVGIARQQSGDERIGEAAMGSDRIDLRAAAFHQPGLSPPSTRLR
jgi:hypothetical protein